MKASAFALAVAGFGIAALIVHAGGQRLAALEAPVIDVIDESDLPPDISGDDNFGEAVTDTPGAADEQSPGEPQQDQPAAPVEPASGPTTQALPATQAVRPVAQGEFVPPPTEQGGLERSAPRAPLSDLSLALPPKPKITAEWDGATLFRPVAAAAGVIEARGLTVSLAGLTPLEPEETCTSDGKTWKCGALGRTALRGLLRGRAVVCDLPEDKAEGEAVAKCRIGKLDVGQWLVANGWARAAAGGPYADAAKKAEDGKKGIFGAPPERVEMTLMPGATSLPEVEAPPEPAAENGAQ